MRLAILVGATLLVVGVLVHMGARIASRREPAVEPPPPPPATVVADVPAIDRDLLSRETRDGTPAERIELERAPLLYLLRVARNFVAEHFDAMDAAEPEVGALAAEPAKFRGRGFRSRGRLLLVERIRPADPSTPVYVRGAMRREDGATIHFLATDEEALDFGRGDFVRVDGIFWKNFESSVDGALVSGPLLVGRRPVPSVEAMEPITAIDPAVLELVRDASAAEMETFQPGPYWHLMSYARHGPEADADFEAAPEMDAEISRQIRENPEAFRGKPFRLFGSLPDRIFPEPRRENPMRLEKISVAWIQNGFWGVAQFQSPEAFEGVGRGDLVWVYAFFLRHFVYETAEEGIRDAPLFVAKRVLRFVPTPSPLLRYAMYGALGLAAATAVVFFLVVFHDQRKAREFQAEFLRRRRGRRSRERASEAPPA